MEAIVLAGGLGTRLRNAVPDLPKCMAPVAGRPFIDYVIEEAQSQSVNRFIFALGYLSDVIIKHLEEKFPELNYSICTEDHPLGTGGAILAASSHVTTSDCVVLNGDTLFRVNLQSLMRFHIHHDALCTLALKPLVQFERYGVVRINKMGRVEAFEEKKPIDQGLINGGVYALNIHQFRSLEFPERFSFEKDFLEKQLHTVPIMGMVHDEYFIVRDFHC